MRVGEKPLTSDDPRHVVAELMEEMEAKREVSAASLFRHVHQRAESPSGSFVI